MILSYYLPYSEVSRRTADTCIACPCQASSTAALKYLTKIYHSSFRSKRISTSIWHHEINEQTLLSLTLIEEVTVQWARIGIVFLPSLQFRNQTLVNSPLRLGHTKYTFYSLIWRNLSTYTNGNIFMRVTLPIQKFEHKSPELLTPLWMQYHAIFYAYLYKYICTLQQLSNC